MRVEANCPVCAGSRAAPALAVRDHFGGESFQIARCASCGTLYVSDPPPPEALAGYYDNDAGQAMHRPPGRLFAALRTIRIRRDLAPLLARTQPGEVVVDLGTGDGSVAAALRAEGRRPLGVDVFEAAEWSRPEIPYHQFSLAEGLRAGDLVSPDGPPVGAVMRHVLEHVSAPHEVLVTLREAGVRVVLVVVPNASSRLAGPLGANWYYWDPPRHLTFFTAATLGRLAERSGFTLAEHGTYGLDELATSAHRALLLTRSRRPGLERLRTRSATVLRPTGIPAGLSSALSTKVSTTVLQALLVAPPQSSPSSQSTAAGRSAAE